MGMDHHGIASPDDIRQMLTDSRRRHDPGLLQKARIAFRNAERQNHDDPQWKQVAEYGKKVAAAFEDPQRLSWLPTSDHLGLVAEISDEDYLVVHPHKQWWRAGSAWPEGPQPTYWAPERFPTREAAIKAAGDVTIPQTPERGPTDDTQ